MRVLIDASSLLLRSAGIKSYTWHWLRALQVCARPDESIRAFPLLGRGLGGVLDHERSSLPLWTTYPRLALLYAANLRWLPALELAAAGSDVVHLSNQVRRAPSFARVTATLHDLTTRLFPEFHTEGNRQADGTFFDRVVLNAAGLIAISENTRRDAVNLLGIPPDRIEVIYNGVDPAYFDASPRLPARPYVLFVGAIEPRKNLDTLLDAWQLLGREDYELYIAGSTGWRADATRARLESGVPGVRWLGYVPERDLPDLTAGASVFAYPSLYEGFGIPVAQAMAAGVPVLTSNTSSLPEVVGGGGVTVDPRSPAEIASGLRRLLDSAELRTRLGQAGRARAQEHFRWSENGRRSMEFFRRVAGR